MESSDPDADGRDHRRPSGISPQTLIIASVASAAASFAVARVWGPGTLVGAAAAPVIVALVAEFLRRPMRTVTATAKRVPTPRMMPGGRDRVVAAQDHTHAQRKPIRMASDPTGVIEPDSPESQSIAHRRVEQPSTGNPPTVTGIGGHATETSRSRSRWRIAVVTGLLAFAIVVGVFTVPDLLAGHSITGNGQQTTFFGRSTTTKKTTRPAVTVTTTTPTTKTKTTSATGTTQPRTTATTPTATRTTTAPTTTSTTPTTTPATTPVP